jgi:hypothetical protein
MLARVKTKVISLQCQQSSEITSRGFWVHKGRNGVYLTVRVVPVGRSWKLWSSSLKRNGVSCWQEDTASVSFSQDISEYHQMTDTLTWWSAGVVKWRGWTTHNKADSQAIASRWWVVGFLQRGGPPISQHVSLGHFHDHNIWVSQ